MDTFGAAPEDFVYSNGHGWAVENLTVGSHTATHIDAPYHYGAMSEGKPARRIDEVPLEWCFGPGVVARHAAPEARRSDLRLPICSSGCGTIDYTCSPGDIVLIHTGAATRWGTPEYFRQPGLDRESTLWLVEPGHPHDRHRRVDARSRVRRADRRTSSAQATAGTSGRRISRASRRSTARSRSWPISSGCRGRTGSTSRACRSRSRAAARAGAARWQWCRDRR